MLLLVKHIALPCATFFHPKIPRLFDIIYSSKKLSFRGHLLVQLRISCKTLLFCLSQFFHFPDSLCAFFSVKQGFQHTFFWLYKKFHFPDRIFHLKRCIQTYFIRIDIFSPQNTKFPLPNPLLFWLVHYFSHIDSSHSQITKFPKTSFSPRQKGHSLSRMPKFTTIYRYRLS